jgi:hypothetical protein
MCDKRSVKRRIEQNQKDIVYERDDQCEFQSFLLKLIAQEAECQSNLDSENRGSSSLIWQVGCSVYYDTTFINLCNLSAILFATRERRLGIVLLLGGFYVKAQTSDDGGSSKDHAEA